MNTQLVNQNGTAVKVTKSGELTTHAIVETERQNVLRKGKSYNANTGWMTLTSATTSAVAFIRNDGADKLVIASIIVGFKQSTGGAVGEPADIYILRNPTGGTIVSTATAMEISPLNKGANRNYGSSTPVSGVSYKGVEGATLTGDEGSTILLAGSMSNRSLLLDVFIEVQNGNSLGVTVKPPTGNTSVDVYVGFDLFVTEDLFE